MTQSTHINEIGAKLIAITNNTKLELYQALGIKIREKIKEFTHRIS